MEIVITLTTSKPCAIFHKRHAQKIPINLKCCNLIGAATIVAARTSEVCVSHQTHHLRNGSGSARLVLVGVDSSARPGVSPGLPRTVK